MSNQDPVLFELDADGVALLTLNRPDKLNACSGAMLTRLAELYRRCDEDDAVRAIVVTGRGRAFCTGADMTDAAKTFDVSKSGGFDHFSAAGVVVAGFPAAQARGGRRQRPRDRARHDASRCNATSGSSPARASTGSCRSGAA